MTLFACANVEQKSPCLAWLYFAQDGDTPFCIGEGVENLLPVEPDGGDDSVLLGVVEFRNGAVELLDVVVPFPPGCWALALLVAFRIGGGT